MDLHKERKYWCRMADDDKDGHYSLFVNAINNTVDTCERHHGVIVESLYSVALTPSALNWRTAYEAASKQVLSGKGGKNLFFCYIDNRLQLTIQLLLGTNLGASLI